MQMRALRLHQTGLSMEVVDVPEPGPDEVLIRVAACGLCDSDRGFVDGSLPIPSTPVTLGHEMAGTVVRSRSAAWNGGDEVVALPFAACGICPRCRRDDPTLCERLSVLGVDRDGGLAEFAVVPGSALVPKPAAVDWLTAATAADAGLTACHALACQARLREGMSMLVVGTGAVAHYAVSIGRHRGAAPIILVGDDPAAFEVDEVVAAGPEAGRAVRMLTGGGVDVTVDTIGASDSARLAVTTLAAGGTAVLAGMRDERFETPTTAWWASRQYTVTGAFGGHMMDLEQVLAWLAAGTIPGPPVRTVGLDQAADALVEPSAERIVVSDQR